MFKSKTPEEELIRAGQARELIAHPIFLEACLRIEQGMADQRRIVPIRDTDMHTRLILTEQLWSNIKDWLEQIAQTGQLAEFEIERRKRLFGLFALK